MKSTRARALVVLAGLALMVSGCSSSSAGTSDGGAAAAPAATTAPAATVTADTGSDAGIDDRLASRLCTALSKTTAQLEMTNASQAAALAQISLALADVYGDDVAQMDATKIETMTKTTCPDVHDEAVKVLKVNSLDELR